MAAVATGKKRAHKATYARDKRTGGYNIRVSGPAAEKFAGKVVPVTMKSGDEHEEELDSLLWTGADNETGEKVALYSFIAKPREETKDAEF